MAYYAVRSYDFPAFVLELSQLLANASEGHNWFALVDTAFDHDGKVLRVPGCEGLPVYHQGQLAKLSGFSPTLYALSNGDYDQLQREMSRLLHHCQGRPMLSFIRSKLSGSELRNNWQNLLEIETEDKERYLLRFGDTRVLPILAGQETIWKRLAADATAWWSIGRDGEVRDLALPTLLERNDNPLEIDNDCLTALLSAGEVDAMAVYMGEYFPELLAVHDGNANYQLLKQTTALCNAQGIDGATEQYALGVAVLLTDGRLLAHPDLTDWLADKTWQTQGMEEALAEFMEDKDIS